MSHIGEMLKIYDIFDRCMATVRPILLLVPPLSATVPKITPVRNPLDMSLPFQWVRRSLPSKLRLAIRRHLPCVGEIGSHANGT